MAVGIDLYDDLDTVERSGGATLSRAACPSLYDRLAWYRLIARHCPPAGRLLVLRAHVGDRSAWLFLARQGHEAQGFTRWYSLRFDAVGDRGEDLLRPLAAALRDQKVHRLFLSPIEDPAPLAAALRAAGWSVLVEPQTANWRALTAGLDFDAYWAARPGRLRNTARRRAKNAPDIEIAIYDRFDEGAWADYLAVYRESWKPEEGSFPFLEALARQEGAAGTLRLGLARRHGRPIAAQYWLVENRQATIHKLAYAEEAKALSPGTLLSMAMFRRAIDEDRVDIIDYGTGDEPYKADWMDEKRTLWRIAAFDPRSLSGLSGLARARASRLARRFRKV